MNRTWKLLTALALLSLGASAQAEEANYWPFWVQRGADGAGRPWGWERLGPLAFETHREPYAVQGLRPLLAKLAYAGTGVEAYHFAYPLFSFFRDGEAYHWSLFNLASQAKFRLSGGGYGTSFELFPFLFYQETGQEETSYKALFPVAGELKNRFGSDRTRFFLFPLWLERMKGDTTRTGLPWPFVQWQTGPHSSGFGLWPLGGHFRREGDYEHSYGLWPFFYHRKDQLDRAIPRERWGALPFYTTERAEGLKSETFVWPFFGYTREWAPRAPYREARYFWPFFVQGRGENKYKNRWMPFYTHERIGNYEKWWYLWPLLRRSEHTDQRLEITRTQLLYFLWWDEVQRGDGFEARKQHLWPLYSYWDNGAGTRQLQALSPLEVFFPHNQVIRETWSPLFALYKYDRRGESVRHDFLWSLVSYQRGPQENWLHLGPFFQRDWGPGYASWEILHGLYGRYHRQNETRTRLFWFELSR